jgi:HEPN domain-containing protein
MCDVGMCFSTADAEKKTCTHASTLIQGGFVYTPDMSQDEAIRHWQKGAKDALEAAEALHAIAKYALALFDAHLAVEKALKKVYIEQTNQDPLPTHNLLLLSEEIQHSWTDEEKELLSELTDYAIDARYDDPEWAQEKATKENSAFWIAKAKHFLKTLL